MFRFSVSSFIDLVNTFACFFLSYRLFESFKKSENLLIRRFSLFYFIFALFFLFLGLPFFIPGYSTIIQTSFVISHLFLYFAITVFLFIFFRLLGFKKISYIVAIFTAAIGFAVFVLSLLEGGEARLFRATITGIPLISWSHGGSVWVRMLIGAGGAFVGVIFGIFFLFYSRRFISDEVLKAKGFLIGTGNIFLGVAALLAFVLSIFPSYNFWIVLTAELVTISGLLIIYSAISRARDSLQKENML